MTPPCKKCDVHVPTNADGLCGKCAATDGVGVGQRRPGLTPREILGAVVDAMPGRDKCRVRFHDTTSGFDLHVDERAAWYCDNREPERVGAHVALLMAWLARRKPACDACGGVGEVGTLPCSVCGGSGDADGCAPRPVDAALSKPAPQLTRTEAIKAYCAKHERVSLMQEPDLFKILVDGVYSRLGWRPSEDALDGPFARAIPADEIIARIDVALAKTTPAQDSPATVPGERRDGHHALLGNEPADVSGKNVVRPQAAGATPAQRPEVGSVHPWAVARADMEAHPEARWNFGGNAKTRHHRIASGVVEYLDHLSEWVRYSQSTADVERVAVREVWTRLPDEPATPARAMEAATTVFDGNKPPTPDVWQREMDLLRAERDRLFRRTVECTNDCTRHIDALRAAETERDHLRHSQSLALDHVVRLRGVSARLVEALDLMTELLKETP